MVSNDEQYAYFIFLMHLCFIFLNRNDKDKLVILETIAFFVLFFLQKKKMQTGSFVPFDRYLFEDFQFENDRQLRLASLSTDNFNAQNTQSMHTICKIPSIS